MSIEGNLPYALARVHARHGRRLDESAWRRIEASRYLGEYLEAVRGSALASWVANIDITREPHAIERSLRSEWRAYVRAVTSWHPRKWQPWLNWWSWLPYLPLIERLARAEPVPVPRQLRAAGPAAARRDRPAKREPHRTATIGALGLIRIAARDRIVAQYRVARSRITGRH